MKILKFSLMFLLIFISCPVKAIYEDIYLNSESIKIIKNDSPSYIDLMVYIPVLNGIVDFCEQYKKILTINLIHGLFLINVNFEQFLKDEDIPEVLRNDLQQLVTKSSKLQDEYNAEKTGKMKKILAALASNATSWSKRLTKLNYELLAKTYAHGEYPTWARYLSTVESMDEGSPNPRQSDKCVGSLVESQENLSSDMNLRCEIPNECYKYIINGTDFGYWLTHRLVLLLHARLSRNCAIFSAHEDQLFKLEFCEQAYREAEYIASNDFQCVDLFLEQIALCALDGHAQFLRRSWLTKMLEFLQPSGCFQLYKLKSSEQPRIENCNDHVMAVALVAYSAAVRLILETLHGLASEGINSV